MEVTRIFDLVDNYTEKYPNQDTVLACKCDGKWKKIGVTEYAETVNNISYGLMALGISEGDKVGIVSGNRPEWNMIDFAIMQIKAVSVPIYPTISQSDYRHILNHAEMKIIFVEGKELRTKLEPIFPELKQMKHIITFVKHEGTDYRYYNELVELGKANPQPEKLAALKASVQPHDLATMLYTSGTTGVPKGVMLSHDNIVQNFKSVAMTPAKWSNKALSFLPLCHAYERMLVYMYQYLGMSVYYAESLGTIADNIKEIHPTMMSCVPRLLEKIYDKLFLAGKKLPYAQRILYYWAFNLATRFQLQDMGWWYNIQYHLADKLIYAKWREAIGGNFDIVVSGGSAIQSHIASFFSAIHMPVFEGYGLTETSPVIAVSARGKYGRKFGTVGQALPGTELKIGENKEILTRGHNVMLGYYKDPELTKQVIDDEGWLHTGDTGELSPEGLLTVTGRLKSIFKTSFGKYVNPQAIESKCCESPFIENMIVLGENKKFVAALISPDFTFLKSWCKKHKLDLKSNEEMVNNPLVIKRFQTEIKKYNPFFGDWEQIKRFEIVSDEWAQANGFLSPTLKIKRNVIENFYADRVEKLFS